MEIIGVRHKEAEIKQAVIEYVDAYYPNLENIMLELLPGYDWLRQNGILADDFFSDIAVHYEARGVRIIPCDRKRLEMVGLTLKEYLCMAQQNINKLRELEAKAIILGLFNGQLFGGRNKDFNEVFQQERPAVSIVGAFHGRYMKRQNPEIHFSYFCRYGLMMEKLFGWLISKEANQTYRIHCK